MERDDDNLSYCLPLLSLLPKYVLFDTKMAGVLVELEDDMQGTCCLSFVDPVVEEDVINSSI